MKRPYLMLYVADWQSNPKLRCCTFGEKGIWMDIMCIMHDQDEYGVIRWPLKQIAQALHTSVSSLRKLVDKEILKGADPGQTCEPLIYTPRHARKDGPSVTLIERQDGPIWYSSRMVRDEYLRLNAKTTADSRFDDEPKPRTTDRERLRKTVWEKTGGYCFYCKTLLGPDWQIDHFIPRSKGGTSKLSNLVPACVKCNRQKDADHPDDWRPPGSSPPTIHGEDKGAGELAAPPHASAHPARPSSSFSDPDPSSVSRDRSFLNSSEDCNSEGNKNTQPKNGCGETPSKTPEQIENFAIWNLGIQALRSSGVTDKNARSFIGKQLRDHGRTAVAAAVIEALAQNPVAPLEYIIAVLQRRGTEKQNGNGNGTNQPGTYQTPAERRNAATLRNAERARELRSLGDGSVESILRRESSTAGR